MVLNYATATSPFDANAYYARGIIAKKITHDYPGGAGPIGGPLIPQVPLLAVRTAKPEGVVGIIGAGVGGLYAGMMLQSLGIPFEILEASERTGGRVFTHEFSEKAHDYYDVGAMRFPEAPVMQRLFNLFHSPLLNNKDDGLDVEDHLIDYLFEDKHEKTFLDYNGKTVPRTNTTEMFNFQDTGVAPSAIQKGAKTILNEVYAPFVEALEEDLRQDPPGHRGWDLLMQSDKYSTRAYMALKCGLDQPTINWLETMSAGTGWFDQALAESVLEWIDFGGNKKEGYKWKCLDGGSQVLPNSMTKYLSIHSPNALQLNKEVSCLSYIIGSGDGEPFGSNIAVKVLNEEKARIYNHVICTLPLPVLRTLNIDEAGLSVQQTNALRQLQYGPSCKIGIKFKSPWWTDKLGIVGGQSFSDRCIRTTVYPSYGLDKDKTSVLIASYTWSQDALRWGALIHPPADMAEKSKARLKELVLRDLAHVHNVDYHMLEAEYEDHFAWDWYSSPLTQGAFALFGPGEFSTLYKELCGAAADGHLHFAGEALSVRHAWIVGALDSAWRAVLEVLTVSYRDKIPEFEHLWGHNEEWVGPPEVEGIGMNVPGVKSNLLVQYLTSRHPSVTQQ